MVKENNKLLVILAIYIALKPIYLWSSGTLQIGDIFLLVGLGYVIVSKAGTIRLNRTSSRLMTLFLVIVLYQAVINGIWSYMIRANISKSTLYYVFNMLAVLLTLLILQDCRHEQVSKCILVGCFISIVITTIGLFLKLGGIRRLSFFNNPNQLGYYALLILSICLYYYELTNAFLKVSILLMAVWAIIASGSKAAFVGAGILILVHLLFGLDRKGTPLNKLIVQIALLVFVAILIYILFFSNSSLVLSNRTLYFVRNRMLSITTENDSALGSSRGYDRILELGTNFLWGMGEGGYYRFAAQSGLEAHSSYVTLIVSYGLFGIIGYIILVWKFISHKLLLKKNLIILSGVLIYGVTHNGLRNTILWILLAVMFSQQWIHEEPRKNTIRNTAKT